MAEDNIIISKENEKIQYDEDNIRHLSDVDHIRTRPGMYVGRLDDGSKAEDGIYVLLKETIDNSIDEFRMNAGKRIEIDVEDHLRVSVRDYGRGIPQGKIIEAVSQLNTGGKYDSKAFKKSVGMNGVGIKAVNFLSSRFEAHSYRDGQVRKVVFEKGILKSDVTELKFGSNFLSNLVELCGHCLFVVLNEHLVNKADFRKVLLDFSCKDSFLHIVGL